MTFSMFSVLSAGVVVVTCGTNTIVANTIINLTQDGSIRDVATYTYYSRASGTDPFTTAFYPGYTANSGYRDGGLAPTATEGAAISFKTGELTNGSLGSVSSWQGIVSTEGNFDIVFDLGANYIITSVVIKYADFQAYRWNIAVDVQQIYLSTDSPANGNLALFSSGTFVEGTDTSSRQYTFNGTATEARYVDFRAMVKASGSSNNGGVLYQVIINGYPIPEVSSLVLLSVSGLLMLRRN